MKQLVIAVGLAIHCSVAVAEDRPWDLQEYPKYEGVYDCKPTDTVTMMRHEDGRVEIGSGPDFQRGFNVWVIAAPERESPFVNSDKKYVTYLVKQDWWWKGNLLDCNPVADIQRWMVWGSFLCERLSEEFDFAFDRGTYSLVRHVYFHDAPHPTVVQTGTCTRK